jgi:hypothetical protein
VAKLTGSLAVVILTHRVSRPQYETTGVDRDDYVDYLTCCSDLDRLASEEEFSAWLASIDGHYSDEPPTLDPAAYHDDIEPEWRAEYYREWEQAEREELGLLLGQRDECEGMPRTLAYLDARVAEIRQRWGWHAG